MDRFLIPLLILVLCPSSGATQTAADSSEIRAAGTAERSVRPDVASLTLRFSVTDSTPGDAGRRLAARADTVRQRLVSLGVPRDSLLTGSRWGWWNRRVEEMVRNDCVPTPDRRSCVNVQDTTYRVHEQIVVRIPDMDLVGRVVDAALDLRIVEVSDVSFYATDTRAAALEATREATIRAREQAEVMASAMGLALGPVLSLGTDRDYGSVALPDIQVFAASVSGTQVTAPSLKVSVTVYGRWRLEAPPR